MHGLPRIAPQSIWLNGAPNWPPCVILLTVSPLTTDGKIVVGTSMHELSMVPSISVPPPVTRQVTAWAQVTEAEQLLGAVAIALPLTSDTHRTLSLAIAVPVAVTVILAPCGHVTSTVQTKLDDAPTGRMNVVGMGLSSRSTEHGKPLITTLRSAWPVLVTVSEKLTGPLSGNVT